MSGTDPSVAKPDSFAIGSISKRNRSGSGDETAPVYPVKHPTISYAGAAKPSYAAQSLESLEKALQKLKNNKNDVKIIVMGDFNIDKKQVLNWILQAKWNIDKLVAEKQKPKINIKKIQKNSDLFINNNHFSVLAELESTQNVDEISSKFTEITNETANQFTT
ncbi:hypothetical protein BB560_004629 [Smittium megazygosporum]|uniref:Endonuclease/exonuclease/phosphatase domain-containing protein n=1 Tax=Smittium megazygosporum TaxID=133381 RepID=A0A2T9Z8R3_9FUNG|nr:hypothetical protein BB560_004629 [Smittium megazygosporum]